MASEKEKAVGLEALDDETLAAIVRTELSEQGKITASAQVALEELNRRTPE